MKEDHSGDHPFMEFATGSRTREKVLSTQQLAKQLLNQSRKSGRRRRPQYIPSTHNADLMLGHSSGLCSSDDTSPLLDMSNSIE